MKLELRSYFKTVHHKLVSQTATMNLETHESNKIHHQTSNKTKNEKQIKWIIQDKEALTFCYGSQAFCSFL